MKTDAKDFLLSRMQIEVKILNQGLSIIKRILDKKPINTDEAIFFLNDMESDIKDLKSILTKYKKQ